MKSAILAVKGWRITKWIARERRAWRIRRAIIDATRIAIDAGKVPPR